MATKLERWQRPSSVVYALTDEGAAASAETIRYIGKTAWAPEYRLREHVLTAIGSAKTHAHNWIRTLLSAGRTPRMHILMISSHEDAGYYERSVIAKFRQSGYRLTNITGGGEGVIGLKHSVESRERMGRVHRGVPLKPEHRAKVVAALQRAAGMPHVRAARAKNIVSITARADVRAKMSAAQKGRPLTPKQIERNMRSAKLKVGSKASEETKKKMSRSHLVAQNTPDALKKSRARMLLRYENSEERAKHSARMASWWAERKAGVPSQL